MAEQSSDYQYSEIFYSAQGEGHFTGCPTAWLRFFTCNLQCNGFGQEDPTDPRTYDLPYVNVNVDPNLAGSSGRCNLSNTFESVLFSEALQIRSDNVSPKKKSNITVWTYSIW